VNMAMEKDVALKFVYGLWMTSKATQAGTQSLQSTMLAYWLVVLTDRTRGISMVGTPEDLYIAYGTSISGRALKS
jgi:hypothetical protein